MIEMNHFSNMKELNDYIEDMKDHYEVGIKVINISSTRDGYDLFFEIIKVK